MLDNDSNTKAELMALWTLISFGAKLNVKKLQVLGYSKTVIDSANKRVKVDVVSTTLSSGHSIFYLGL